MGWNVFTTEQMSDLINAMATLNAIVGTPQTLSPASETVSQGFYASTTLSAEEIDLVIANIKTGVNIFGKVGTYDTEAVNPVVAGRMKTGDIAFVNGAKITGSGTQTLSDANDTVAAGYYAATTLHAVDADLAVGNIKTGVDIFGFTGTYDTEAGNPITAGDVVEPHVGFVNGAEITGTVTEKVGSATILTPSTVDQAIPEGRYGGVVGDGKVLGDANLVVGKIKAGVTIFEVVGTYETPLTGDAAVDDVLDGKFFYKDDATSKLEGTLALTGDATVGDVLDGIFFYKDDAKTKLEGTLALTGDAVVGDVLDGVFFYKDDAKTKLEGTLALTGDAVVGDVKAGKLFYKDDPKTQLEGTLATVALDPALDEYPAGYHVGAASLHAIDADLATGNIKSGVTIFGVAGSATIQDISDADAVEADVALNKTFYSITGAKKTGTHV